MSYEDKYRELEQYCSATNTVVRKRAENWAVAIGLQNGCGTHVSEFLVGTAIRNIKGEISADEIHRLIEEHWANIPGDQKRPYESSYEIIPPDSPRVKKMEAYNRKLRPGLYAQIDKEKQSTV